MHLKNLTAARVEKGYSVAELATASSITTQHLYALESGNNRASPSTALLLAMLLGKTVDQLLDGEEVAA